MTTYSSLHDLNDASSQRIVIMRIKRIVEKYPEVWRVFHEPIQNAMDAIQRRDKKIEGTIDVKIHVESGKIAIADDGNGFPADMKLLLPDGTDKSEHDDTLGYQGVGLKSVIYSSRRFRLVASDGALSWGVEIVDAKKYLESDGAVDAPIIELDRLDRERGTSLEIVFDKQTVINALEQMIDSVTTAETNFRWRSIEELEQTNYFLNQYKNHLKTFDYLIQYYLRTQTYVGSVNRLLNCRFKSDQDKTAKRITINLEIDLSGLEPSDTDNVFLSSVIERANSAKNECIRLLSMPNKMIDFQEIIEEINRVNPRHVSFDIYDFDIPPGGIKKNPQLMNNVYCRIMTPDYYASEADFAKRYSQYISLLNGPSDERKDKNIRNFRDLFPRILGIYILVGRLEIFEKYIGNNFGMKFIAANGIPTQHELTARSSNQSFYFNPITFVLNIDGKLNEGKTHLIDQNLERKCVRFFREAFESSLSRLAQEFVRTVPNSTPGPEIDLVDRLKIDIPGIDIRREPVDENTLIALFYQLLIKKGIDLPTYGLMSQGIFDGKFAYQDSNIRSNNDLSSLEFKVKLSALLNDFYDTNSLKQFDACDLIVVWDATMTNMQSQEYRVVERASVDTASLRQSRSPDWVRTLIRDTRQVYRPIIIVKEWVREYDLTFQP